MSNHPEHKAFQYGEFGHRRPAKPLRGSWLVQAQAERNCMENGGHWWHPEVEGLIDWYCCRCGAEDEGMPQDGTGNSRRWALLFAKLLDSALT
jgi:hypothetical protein